MPIWSDSECETFFASEHPSQVEPCEVRIGNGRIVIDANGARGGWMYSGEEVGPGHFHLTCSEREGKGSLHRFEDDDILVGWWQEGKDYGMWRMTLGRPDSE